jgi:hypothetical protein
MKQGSVLLLFVALLSGCSTLAASRYSISVDNVVALRTLNGKTIDVGAFSSSQPGKSEIKCRGVGPIRTPDGEPFSEFIRKALVDDLRMANVFSPTAPVTLTGNLDEIDFDSHEGKWNLALTITSSNGRLMVVKEDYSYTKSFGGNTACDQTAQALMPAVQNLVGKIVRSPDFIGLISE